MIKVESLHFQYDKHTPVLEDISFELGSGDTLALMGPSGCGKSTLLRILMGIEKGATGTLKIGETVHSLKNWNVDQEVFGMVPQVPHLLPWKTVFENVYLAACTHSNKTEAARLTKECLEAVQLSDYSNKYPWEISQGMASRVSFARTYALRSRALLLDEPFAALDAHTRMVLQKWYRAKQDVTGMPSIFVTHDINEALEVASRIVVVGGRPARVCQTFFRSSWDNPSGISAVKTEIFNLLSPAEKI